MKRPLVILVAEDDVIVRNLINVVLTRAGYSVLLAADGYEALALSRHYAGPIDLLLSDVVMPRMNGLELSAIIRAERPAIRALLISGRMSSEITAGNAQFHFLRKPFLPAQLNRKINEMLTEPAEPGLE